MEAFQSMSADPLKKCPECGRNTLKRKIGMGAGIIFKGSGFYETDYKKKDAPASSSGDGEGNAKSETKGESKTEAKKETASTSGTKKNDKSGGGNGKK
jgi:putative FmdB family regulatory protein